MLTSVDSSVKSIFNRNIIEPNYSLWIGSTEYTDYVYKWPTISVDSDTIISKSLTIELANEDGTFNNFLSSKLNIVKSASLFYKSQKQELYFDTSSPLASDWLGVCVSINESGRYAALSAVGVSVASTFTGGQVYIANVIGRKSVDSLQVINDPLVNTLQTYWGACTTFVRNSHTYNHSYDLLLIGQQRRGSPEGSFTVTSLGAIYCYAQSIDNGHCTLVSSFLPTGDYVRSMQNFGNCVDAVYVPDSYGNIIVRAIVGAPRGESRGSVWTDPSCGVLNSGHVFIYQCSLSNYHWSNTHLFSADSNYSGDYCGNAVGISGDSRRIVYALPNRGVGVYSFSGICFTRTMSPAGAYWGGEQLVPNSPAFNSYIGVNNYTQNRTISINDSGTMWFVGAPYFTRYTASNSIYQCGGVLVFVESSNGNIAHHDTIWHPEYTATTYSTSDANGLGTFVTGIYSSNNTVRLLCGVERDSRRIFRGGSALDIIYSYSHGIEAYATIYPTEVYSAANYGYYGDLATKAKKLVVGAVDYGGNQNKAYAGRSYVHKLENIPTIPASITLFQGNLETFKFSKGKAIVIIRDKMKSFGDLQVGNNESPAVFSSATMLPSDIFWSLVTSYGNLDSTANSSNPDINYSAFLDWAAIFSGDSVYMGAQFSGVKVLEALRKLARHTQSTIVVEEGKLSVKRYSTTETPSYNYVDSNTMEVLPSITDYKVINKQWVLADYNTTSNMHATEVFDVNTASVNSFGLHEDTDSDASLWYVGSASALNLAQRVVSTYKLPELSPDLKVPHVGLIHAIGDIITISDSHYQMSGDTFRVLGYRKNLHTGEVRLRTSDTTLNSPFILDVSELDGTDVLT